MFYEGTTMNIYLTLHVLFNLYYYNNCGTNFLNPVALTCAANWELDETSMICYQYVSWATWNNANKRCQSTNPKSTLRVFHNVNEYNSFLLHINYFENHFACGNGLHLGIISNSSGTYWVDGTQVTFSFWRVPPKQGYCSYDRVNGGNWNGQLHCGNVSAPYYCQYRLSSPISTVSPQTAQITDCPKNFVPDESDICYHETKLIMPWADAESHCETINSNSTLPVFCVVSEINSYRNYRVSLAKVCEGKSWLGFRDNTTTGSFYYVNEPNRSLNTFWYYSNPACLGTSSCVFLDDGHGNYTKGSLFENTDCSYSFEVICQYRPFGKCSSPLMNNTPYCPPATGTPNVTVQVLTQCPNGSLTERSFPNICYFFNDTWQLYTTSIKICDRFYRGATLPIFKSLDEYQSYSRLAWTMQQYSTCASSVWLGARNTEFGFRWLDNSSLTFNLWKNGHPSLVYGNCSVHQHSGGFWFSEDCITAYKGYVCQLRINGDQKATTVKPTTVVVCPANFTSDSLGFCYLKVDSAKTWNQSQAACKSMHPNATLPILCNDEELLAYNDWQRSQFLCSTIRWIGFSDIESLGTFKWQNTNTTIDLNWSQLSGPKIFAFSTCGASLGPASATVGPYENFNCTIGYSSHCQIRPYTGCKDTYSSTVVSTTQLTTIFDVISNSPSFSATMLDSIPFLVQNMNDSIKYMLGYPLDEMVHSCMYNNVPCNLKQDFTYIYNPLLGNCYTFNAGVVPKYRVSSAGSSYGLKLVLESDPNEYICVTNFAGFKAVLHENNITPFPDAEGSNIQLSISSAFSIRQEALSRLGWPYASCKDSVNKTYSVEACQRNCYQQQMIEACNCADPRYLLLVGCQYCGPDQKECLDYHKTCSHFDKFCDCPSSCKETNYHHTSTFASLQMPIFYNASKNNRQVSIDYTILNVYFDQMTVLQYVENPEYGLYDIYSDVCSITGLILGLSAIGLVEITYISMLMVANCLKQILEN